MVTKYYNSVATVELQGPARFDAVGNDWLNLDWKLRITDKCLAS